MPETNNEFDADQQLEEFEDNMPPWVLEVNRARTQAQNDLMAIVGASNLGPITRAQAHERLYYPTGDTEQELATSYGYNLRFNGFGFSGYAKGPLLIGGSRGQELAQTRGSYDISTGLLTSDTLECATLYSKHLCSYVEYDLGMVIVKVTDPGSPEAVMELVERNDEE